MRDKMAGRKSMRRPGCRVLWHSWRTKGRKRTPQHEVPGEQAAPGHALASEGRSQTERCWDCRMRRDGGVRKGVTPMKGGPNHAEQAAQLVGLGVTSGSITYPPLKPNHEGDRKWVSALTRARSGKEALTGRPAMRDIQDRARNWLNARPAELPTDRNQSGTGSGRRKW